VDLNRDDQAFVVAMCAQVNGRQFGIQTHSSVTVIWIVIVGVLTSVAGQGKMHGCTLLV